MLRSIATAVVLVVALVAGYLLYLDRLITNTFEGRRWSVPARVYAQPLEIYAGRPLSRADFEVELKRVGYRAVPRAPDPGTYARGGETVRVFLRPFHFNDEARPARSITVKFGDSRVVHLAETAGDEVALARLDPPVIGSIFPSHGEDRLIIAPADTPELLTETLKTVEDRNFDEHRGFDLVGIARALWVNLSAGEIRQGGSTLTQQLVKSYFLDNRRTVARKVKELLMAVILEARFEKADLLNAYVNEIFIGQDGNRAVHGFGLGSQFYFNKPLTELAPHEIATLVAVIRGPSYYDPFRHAERAKVRRDRVLVAMEEFGLIDATTRQRAIAQPLGISRETRRGGGYYPAFMDLVRTQLREDYDADDLASRGYRLFTTLDPRIQEYAERAVSRTLDGIESWHKLPAGELEAAVLVTSTQTGDVLALVGGRKPAYQGFNRVLNAHRPVGSLIKPVVYLTAFETGEYHLASIIDDAPLALPLDREHTWQPANFDGEVHGPVPLLRALGDSLNLATVRLGLGVGVDAVAERLGALLGQPPPAALPSLLLGAVDLTPLDMARLYSVFASGGFRSPVKSVIAVEDEAGATLTRYPLQVDQAADPDAVTEVNVGLKAVMSRGTGATSAFAARGVAGKTGTSDDFRDSWFVGFDHKTLAVVWVGYDDNRVSSLTGSNGAMLVWDALMSELSPTPVAVATPRTFATVDIDYKTGYRATSDCGDPMPVPIPYNADVHPKPGCGMTLRDWGARVREWFR